VTGRKRESGGSLGRDRGEKDDKERGHRRDDGRACLRGGTLSTPELHFGREGGGVGRGGRGGKTQAWISELEFHPATRGSRPSKRAVWKEEASTRLAEKEAKRGTPTKKEDHKRKGGKGEQLETSLGRKREKKAETISPAKRQNREGGKGNNKPKKIEGKKVDRGRKKRRVAGVGGGRGLLKAD